MRARSSVAKSTAVPYTHNCTPCLFVQWGLIKTLLQKNSRRSFFVSLVKYNYGHRVPEDGSVPAVSVFAVPKLSRHKNPPVFSGAA